jgi:hypothetical protein
MVVTKRIKHNSARCFDRFVNVKQDYGPYGPSGVGQKENKI